MGRGAKGWTMLIFIQWTAQKKEKVWKEKRKVFAYFHPIRDKYVLGHGYVPTPVKLVKLEILVNVKLVQFNYSQVSQPSCEEGQENEHT